MSPGMGQVYLLIRFSSGVKPASRQLRIPSVLSRAAGFVKFARSLCHGLFLASPGCIPILTGALWSEGILIREAKHLYGPCEVIRVISE